MRKIKFCLLALAIFVMTSCSKDNKPRVFDPDRKISLVGVSLTPRSTGEVDTVDIIIRHGDRIRFRAAPIVGEVELPSGKTYYEGTPWLRRDFENKRFIFGGDHVIITDPDQPTWSRLGDFITVAEDVVFTVLVYYDTKEYVDLSINTDGRGYYPDTLGYIPNKILKKVQQEIKDAYAKGDFETCYRIFDTEFRFHPITGERWRALKEAGIE